jgi:hypothetical protein
VIHGKPTIDKGLELRAETSNDVADADRKGNESDRAIVAIENLGRSTATIVTIRCTVGGLFLPEDSEAHVQRREFQDQTIVFEALAPHVPRYVEIRSMPGIPTYLKFDSITAAGGQPATLVALEPIEFAPRS